MEIPNDSYESNKYSCKIVKRKIRNLLLKILFIHCLFICLSVCLHQNLFSYYLLITSFAISFVLWLIIVAGREDRNSMIQLPPRKD